MALINLRDIHVSFGGPTVLEKLDLQIEKGERVCLIGRNGEGKSTLMKVVCGEVVPEAGQRECRQGVKIARLAQEVPGDLDGSVYDVIAAALDDTGTLIAEHHRITEQLSEKADDLLLAKLETVQHHLDAGDGWRLRQRIETVLSRLELDGDGEFTALSGGLKRRALLARALVAEPDLLLLDEPTNHLDIDAIKWLETFLLSFKGALLFVTHDRTLLEKLATRIIELDRGRLTSWPGDYRNYLRRVDERIEAENKERQRIDRKLAREEIWVRQGIKARRTRNEGRVRALEALRKAARERRDRTGSGNLDVQSAGLSGKIVAEVKHVAFRYDTAPCIADFSTAIMRGDKIGVIGANGSGKTTLLRIVLGELTPQHGSVRLGARLEVAYYDQMRAQLDEEKSVHDNVADNGSHVTVNGLERHVIGYLKDFLFTPERARTPVKALSGGERNRLMLAKLFAKPANVLVMDEPTNDLDVETLELLEERLVNYTGTLLLVSHDRTFLNNVVTSTLVFEGDGIVGHYIGGYDDMVRQRQQADTTTAETEAAKAAETPKKRIRAGKSIKLTFNEERELKTLPGRIEVLEGEQKGLHEAMGDPAFYQRDGEEIGAAQKRLEELEEELHESYRRWEDLEEKREKAAVKER